MVKTMKVHERTHALITKNVIYPESLADTLDRLLDIKGVNKK